MCPDGQSLLCWPVSHAQPRQSVHHPQSTALNTTLASKLDPKAKRQQSNATGMLALLSALRQQEATIREGGGAKAIDAQHAKQRLTARERIALPARSRHRSLRTRPGGPPWSMYAEWGGAPAAGVVTGIGRVAGRPCMIIANDATVKAGAFFPMTAKKVLRAQRIAMENRLPLVYLVDSAGVFLPLQDEVFPDEDDFGRIFRNNAVISAAGIPQFAAIMGNCVAGGGYLPVLCDKLLMTEGSGLYLAGPALVKAAIGQEYSTPKSSAAPRCTPRSAAPSTSASRTTTPASSACARLVAKLGHPDARALRPRPLRRREGRRRVFRRRPLLAHRSRPRRPRRNEYDVRELHRVPRRCAPVRRVQGRVRPDARLRLRAARRHRRRHRRQSEAAPAAISHAGEKRMQFGGVIYVDSADKAARFVMDCNQNRVPLLFLQDVNGFMVGRDAEQAGIIRAGAKLVNAISNTACPKITVIIGGSFGAGNYALCGKAFDPRFIFAWPTARYAVMGGASAAGTLLEIRIRALERDPDRGGRKLSDAEKQEIRASIQASYDAQTDCRYAAARLWVDAILDPAKTRESLLLALEAAAHNPEVERFHPGVLQT